MEEKFDQNKYIQQYQKEHYQSILIQAPKEQHLKERAKEQAQKQGLSLNQFIIRAIEKELEWYE